MTKPLYPRFVKERIREMLKHRRVVLLRGPRQSGKTTLVQQFANESIPFFTLDSEATLDSVRFDPETFVHRIDRAVIDEIQRAPELILAIKRSVDTDPRPGRFLLTGSANIMTLPQVADSLAGRMSTIPLLPLAQGELLELHPSFLDEIFSGATPKSTIPLVGQTMVDAVLTGGYPEVLTLPSWQDRQDWHNDYVESLIQRDIRDIARLDRIELAPRLLEMLAQYSGHTVNYSDLATKIGLSHVTTRKYVSVLESLFLVRTLRPWYSNTLKRLTKSPKLHFLDSGLLAAAKGVSPDHIRRNRSQFGSLLECFVFSELLKLDSWNRGRFVFSYFRDRDGNEVDFVIEDRRGRVVGVEVKASATVSRSDFRGLRRLSTVCEDRFVSGAVLYTGTQILPFGDRMAAMPISALWS